MSFSADPPDSKSGIQDDTDVNVDGKVLYRPIYFTYTTNSLLIVAV